MLHPFVIGSSAPFGDNPVDDLIWIGNIASFTMNAVSGVDFQLEYSVILHRLINRGRTKILARIAVFDRAPIGAHIEIVDDQMRWLVLFVACAGVIYVGEAIEC